MSEERNGLHWDNRMDMHAIKSALWLDESKIKWNTEKCGLEILTPKLCKMIMAGLGWTAKDLAEQAMLRAGTVSLYLNGGNTHTHTLEIIGTVLANTNRVEIVDCDCVRVLPFPKK